MTTRRLYWRPYTGEEPGKHFPRCKTCGFNFMIGEAPGQTTVISCHCGDTEVPSEAELGELLVSQARVPTPEEYKSADYFAKRWNELH
jgi:hypothetical protein